MRYLLLALICTFGWSVSGQDGITVEGTNDLRLRFDGRVTLDGAMYIPQTDINGVKYGVDDFRFSNATNISQLRLGLNALFGEKWSGRFDADFSNRRVSFTDITIGYDFDEKNRLIIGYYKDPVSMENSTSSRLVSMQTPMAVSILTRGERYLGVTYVTHGRRHWFAGGVYAGQVGSRTTIANRGDDGYGVSARAAYIPVNNDYTTIHLGGYARWRKPDPSEGYAGKEREMTVGGLPESNIDYHRFLGFTAKGVTSYLLAGVEAAIKFDRLYFTGEYLLNNIERSAGKSVFASGWTLTGSYMLKGKQRAYVASSAIFSPVANVSDGGNIEIVGRLGQINLNNQSVSGGQAFSAMCGVNWYPRANFLFGLNYTYMDLDKHANEQRLIWGIPERGIDFHTVQLRAQFIF